MATTIDELAIMIKKGFDEVHERLDKQAGDIAELREGQTDLRDEMARQFALIQSRIDEMSQRIVYREEFDELKREVATLRAKLASA